MDIPQFYRVLRRNIWHLSSSMITRSRRRKQRPFNRPSAPFDAVNNSASGKAGERRPILNAPSLTIVGVKTVCALVASLLCVSCPSAIHRPSHNLALLAMSARITAVIVDAINRESVRRIAHVSSKYNHVAPTLTQLDSATSVVLVGSGGSAVATLLHSAPHAVNLGALSGSIEAVNCLSYREEFALEATAALTVSAGQICSWNRHNGPAITEASPYGLSATGAVATDSVNDNQPAESAPDQIHRIFGEAAHFAHLAPTGFRSALSKRKSDYRLESTANTATLPNYISMDVSSNSPNGGEVSESLSGNIFDVWVKDGTLFLGFNHSHAWLSSSAGPPLTGAVRRAYFTPQLPA